MVPLWYRAQRRLYSTALLQQETLQLAGSGVTAVQPWYVLQGIVLTGFATVKSRLTQPDGLTPLVAFQQ